MWQGGWFVGLYERCTWANVACRMGVATGVRTGGRLHACTWANEQTPNDVSLESPQALILPSLMSAPMVATTFSCPCRLSLAASSATNPALCWFAPQSATFRSGQWIYCKFW